LGQRKTGDGGGLIRFFWHNTEKWLVKISESIDGKGVEESLVKVVSLNFFCI
jgi:hypothetical protein